MLDNGNSTFNHMTIVSKLDADPNRMPSLTTICHKEPRIGDPTYNYKIHLLKKIK